MQKKAKCESFSFTFSVKAKKIPPAAGAAEGRWLEDQDRHQQDGQQNRKHPIIHSRPSQNKVRKCRSGSPAIYRRIRGNSADTGRVSETTRRPLAAVSDHRIAWRVSLDHS